MNRKLISGSAGTSTNRLRDYELLSRINFEKLETKDDVELYFRRGYSTLMFYSAPVEQKVAFMRLAVERLHDLDLLSDNIEIACNARETDEIKIHSPRKDYYVNEIFSIVSADTDYLDILHQYFAGVLRIADSTGKDPRIIYFLDDEKFNNTTIAGLFSSQENVSTLLHYITQMRMCFPQQISVTGEFPLQYAMGSNLCFEITEGVFVSPITDSFRRFVLFEKDGNGNPKNTVEIKIPGELASRYDVDRRGYDVAIEVKSSFGSNNVIVDPIMRIELAGEFRIYGKRVQFTNESPLRIIVFDYTDGLRIDPHFSPWKMDTVMEKLSHKTGLSAAEMKYTIARETLKAVRAVHRCGYVGTTDMQGNPDIPVVINNTYEKGVFEQYGLDAERLVSLGVLITVPAGEGVYHFETGSLAYEELKLKMSDDKQAEEIVSRVRTSLRQTLTSEEIDNLIDLLSAIRKGTVSAIKVIGDMHLGNFKVVVTDERGEKALKVLSVSDTETFVKPKDPVVLDRVSRLEVAYMIDSLKGYGFEYDNETYGAILAEADAGLDRLDLQ